MNSNGVIRRIDELGRVVIPIEMRKYLNIKEGENIEFTMDNDIILLQKKSSPKQNIKILEDIEKTLCSVVDGNYVITDREKILYSSNKELLNTNLTENIINLLNKKEELIKYYINNKELYLFTYSFDNNVAGLIILYDIGDINKYIKLIRFICVYLNDLLSIS